MERRKLFFIIGGASAVVIILGIFFVSILRRPPPPERVTLQFWGTYDDETLYSDIIRLFRKDHPTISIEYRQIPFSDYESTLVSAFAAGTGPDIFLMHNTWLPKHQDKIFPLTEDIAQGEAPLMTFKAFGEQFVDTAVADLTRGGAIYGMPLYVDTLALYYNKDLFHSNSIAVPPRTWEDFVADVDILTRRDDKNNLTASAAAIGASRNINRSTDLLMLLMLQTGVRMTDTDNRSATFSKAVGNLPVGENAVQFYTDFANESKPDRYTWNDQQKYSIDAFADGNTAMMFNYSHHIRTLRAKSPRLNFGIAPIPQPKGAAIKVTFPNYWAAAVAKQSQYPEAAWEFIAYLTSRDGAASYLESSLRPPARRDLIELVKNDPDYGTFVTQALSARSWYQADNVAIEGIFATLIDDVNFNRSTVRAALQEAEARVNVIMSKQRQ